MLHSIKCRTEIRKYTRNIKTFSCVTKIEPGCICDGHQARRSSLLKRNMTLTSHGKRPTIGWDEENRQNSVLLSYDKNRQWNNSIWWYHAIHILFLLVPFLFFSLKQIWLLLDIKNSWSLSFSPILQNYLIGVPLPPNLNTE